MDDDRSHVLIFLVIENDCSAVALVAPITNSSLIASVKDGISSQFFRSQF